MLKRLSGSSSSSSASLWRPRNPHSVDYLKYLHGILIKNETVTEGNKMLLVEALRALAELLIWGDQNDSAVFDFFLERQMLSHFLSIMRQKCGSYICVQLLQTLNILFENMRHETSLYFLLSNNHINSIITHKFNFDNEEIMAYYISFLKTLSFRLNTNTIHFFFNEASREFPLYVETIKFFNHSESMVRIAVRTITLNIYKVRDESMQNFVRLKSRQYFCILIDSIAQNSVEIDQFARSAENESSNRDRLSGLVDEYIDYVHYLNDIFLAKDEDLSALLSEIIFQHLLAPLYLCSLCTVRLCCKAVLITPVSALFFLSNFLLIITESQVVQAVLSSFLFGDCRDITFQWIRGKNAMLILENVGISNVATTIDSKIFFNRYLSLLKCNRVDHSSFFGILLLYAICQNKGIITDILEATFGNPKNGSIYSDSNILTELLEILTNCSKPDSAVRTITVELCCIVLRQLLLPAEEHADAYAFCEQTAVAARREIVNTLSSVVYSEDLFLEMFEDEYYHFEREIFRVDIISVDPSLLLPPSNTPLSGVQLKKRLPSGNEERIRRSIQLFFHIRKFIFDLMGKSDIYLPLSSADNAAVELNDCINLDNSDLLSCTVVISKSERLQRFLVADQIQLILVEPDSKRLGWAIVRFVGLLQDTHITGDPSDSRALHIVVNDARSRSEKRTDPLLTAKFIFDDHIRCMAAKQRLTKGRQKARQSKLDLICDLLEMPKKNSFVVHNKNPFRIVRGCVPGSIRKQLSRSPSSAKSSSTSLNIVPDDPKPEQSPSFYRKLHGIQDL